MGGRSKVREKQDERRGENDQNICIYHSIADASFGSCAGTDDWGLKKCKGFCVVSGVIVWVGIEEKYKRYIVKIKHVLRITILYYMKQVFHTDL